MICSVGKEGREELRPLRREERGEERRDVL